MKQALRYLPLMCCVLLLVCSATALAAPSDTVVQGQDLSGLLHADLSWQDKLGLILTNPVVSTILLILGIAGVVIEIATVGSFGVFGVVGGVSFVLYFLGAFWYGSFSTASIWLLILGVILLVLEIFVIPGFGICGGIGILGILASLVLAAPNPIAAIWSLLIALVIAGVLIYVTLKNKKTRKLWNKLILSQKLDGESGFDSADVSLVRFLGQRGRSLTALRPAGTAWINGEKVDVVTQGEFIDPGQPVEVILVEGVRVVVRSVTDQP